MILVTGATGFLGSHLVKALSLLNIPVRALYRNKKNISSELLALKNVEWQECDILDIIRLEEVFERVTLVYHCAAFVSFEKKHRDEMMLVNVKGTSNLVNMALHLGLKKFLHVSSIAALGRTNNEETITEKTKWEDSPLNSQYAISKYLSEQEVWRAGVEGLDAVIINPSIILGPGYWNSGSGRFFETAKNGLSYYPRGMNGFVGVDDVVDCMIFLMNSGISNERFILNSENYSYKDLLVDITRSLKVKQPTIELKPWIVNIASRVSSLVSLLTGKQPFLTKETANNANNIYKYSNSKIFSTRSNDWSFDPIKNVIEATSKIYLSQIKK
jgi:dihydroflavonol-4-reductase